MDIFIVEPITNTSTNNDENNLVKVHKVRLDGLKAAQVEDV